MKASELIEILQDLSAKWGDAPVCDKNEVEFQVVDVADDFLENKVSFRLLIRDFTNPKVCANESE